MIIILLSLVSLLAVYSATGTLAYAKQHGNTGYYLVKHLMLQAIGFGLIILFQRIPYRYYSGISTILLGLTIPLLLFTLAMGSNLNHAARWVTIPGIGLTIQSSDFAKLAIILFISRQLSKFQDKISDLKIVLVKILLPVGMVCVLIMPANLSTALMVFVTCLIMMFIGRVKMKHLMLIMAAGIVGLAMFVSVILLTGLDDTKIGERVTTWGNRIENFGKNSKEDEAASQKENFQPNQAKIAIVTGGLLGKGPGNSTQRNLLPHPYSDFIYAIIIEEYGLIFGGLGIMVLYLILLYRTGVIIRKCDRAFPAFIAIGLTLLLVFQALINMAVAVNLFPVTGQTLPLVSMGGSSILFTGISFGIILSVSSSIENKQDETKKEKADTDNEESETENDQENEQEDNS
jgi:cell division protein FtsW